MCEAKIDFTTDGYTLSWGNEVYKGLKTLKEVADKLSELEDKRDDNKANR